MPLPLPIVWRMMPVGGPAMNRTGAGRSPAGRGPWMHGFYPLPGLPSITITGITRDNAGAPLGNCEVELYRRVADGGNTLGQFVERTTSDGSGNFTFRLVGLGQNYQHIAYQVGSPDKAGISARTLVGA
jgi:hypothetical protein